MYLFKTPRFLKWVYPERTWSFSVKEPFVYLTFDDGPIPEVTPKILDFLKEKQAKATFFCVGENVLKYPEIFERIKREGHVIGNHTHFHSHAFKTTKENYSRSLKLGNQATSSTLFRPPYGRLWPKMGKEIAKTNKIIMWTFLTYDWNHAVSLKTIEKKINQIKAGDIIVLHDNLKSAHRVLPILEMLFREMKQKQLTAKGIEA